MSEEQIVQFLQDNADYMVNNDIISWLFRTIGWWLVKGMSFLIDLGKDLYNFTFGLVDITSWSGLEDWLNEFRPLIVAILTLSLMVLGFMYMFGKNKKHNVLYSILIFGVVVTSSTYLFSTFNEWTIVFKDAVIGGEGVADGTELIRSSLYDILYIDDEIGLKNMSDDNRPQYAYLSEEETDYIKITEVVNWDDVEDSDTKDILKKKLLFKTGGASSLKDVSNGVAWTSVGNDLYFRYKFNFFTFYLAALAIILIFFCLSYKNVRISYELIVGRLLATIKAGDISTMKKMVKILSCIRDQYYALCFTAITIRSFYIFSDFINEAAGSHSVMRGIVTLFVAFCVIDGSNIMQQISGVDAGLSTMTGKLLATTHMIQAAAAGINQHRVLSALRGGKTEAKSGGQPADKGNIEGSRIGVMQFGRDNGSSMDKDLNSTKENMQGGQPGKNNSPTGENAEKEAKERAGMSSQHEQMAGMNDQREQMAGTDAAGSINDMDQELGSDGRQAMQEEEMSETGSGQTDQMDKDLEGASGYDSSYQDSSSSNSQNTGEVLPESEMSRANPESNMFDKWGEKYAGGEGEASMKAGGQADTPYNHSENTAGKKNTAFKEPSESGRKPIDEQPFKNETGRVAGSTMGHQQKYQGNTTSKKPTSFETTNQTTPKVADVRETKAEIKTSANRTAKVTQERVGKDRYVGGEAISTKKKPEKPNKWEK